MKSIIFILTFICVFFSGNMVKSYYKDSGTSSGIKTESSVQDTLRYIYVGAETCAGKCHNNEEMGHQYDSWKGSRHSKSYESLSTEKAILYYKEAGLTGDPRESLVCLKCHVTAAGFDTASLGPTYNKEDGITCESCHKGEFIPKTFLPTEADCLKCHNNSIHEVTEFDFNERCLKISHPRPQKKQQ